MLYKHQIQFIADLGYHVAVPCLRGFGHSSQPPHVSAYSTVEVAKDIIGLVKALGHSECIAVAHDWGALHCWHHALLYPEVLKALFIVSIPCWEGSPRVGLSSKVDPLAFARQIYPKDEAFWYLRYHNYDYLDTVGRPEDEYDADPRTIFRKMMGHPSEAKVPTDRWKWESAAPARAFGGRKAPPSHRPDDTGWFARFPLPVEFQNGAFVDEEDKEYWVNQFTHSGFKHPVDHYRNVDKNWRDFAEDPSMLGRKIEQPTAFIFGGSDGCTASNDWRGWLTPADWDGKDPAVWQDAMRNMVPNLQELVCVPKTGHWILMEAPDAVNPVIRRFLAHPDTQAAIRRPGRTNAKL